MVRQTKLSTLLFLMLFFTACNGDPFHNRSGAIPMLPFSDTELGIQGNRPFHCTQVGSGSYDCTDLNPVGNPVTMNQLAFDGSLEELEELLSQQVDAPVPTTEVDVYQSAQLSWKLYTLETPLKELGPSTYHIQLALAEDEVRCYLIALATQSEDYQADKKMYDAIYNHALYAFKSVE